MDATSEISIKVERKRGKGGGDVEKTRSSRVEGLNEERREKEEKKKKRKEEKWPR